METGVQTIRAALKSQYHASLQMLRESVERCPDDLWLSRDEVNASWQIAYHTLFFTHLYLQVNRSDFRPWKHHQGKVQHEDGIAGPPDPESPLPLIPEPYSKEQVLEYWRLCDGMVDDAVNAMDVLSPDSGFSWYPISKLEHQIVNIRHLQLGAAQLGARLRSRLNIGIPWVGYRRAPK